jgi:hypothetical protein
MTSFRQIAANRRNARKSTGPTTEEGKQRSRCNAVRHGLTAETVIGALEDAEDYKAFEAAITADYDAQSAVERELILRLASLLWRLHRATTIETGLFEIQADHLTESRRASQLQPASREVVYALFRRAGAVDDRKTATDGTASALLASAPNSVEATSIITSNSHAAICVWQICPILRSTASAATKQPCGVNSARRSSPSMPWIAVNLRKEGADSKWAIAKSSLHLSTTIIDRGQQERCRAIPMRTSNAWHSRLSQRKAQADGCETVAQEATRAMR